MQVEVDVKCMETNFVGCGHFGFGDFAPFCLIVNDFLLWFIVTLQIAKVSQTAGKDVWKKYMYCMYF